MEIGTNKRIGTSGPPRGPKLFEVRAFLTHLDVDANVSPSTQNQALAALLFLYRDVLDTPLAWPDNLVHAKRPHRLPTVLTRHEIHAILHRMQGTHLHIATLLYGAGLRLAECLRLRVKDVNFAADQIVVRHGKGGKDRVTLLPLSAKHALARHVTQVRGQRTADLALGWGYVELPNSR